MKTLILSILTIFTINTLAKEVKITSSKTRESILFTFDDNSEFLKIEECSSSPPCDSLVEYISVSSFSQALKNLDDDTQQFSNSAQVAIYTSAAYLCTNVGLVASDQMSITAFIISTIPYFAIALGGGYAKRLKRSQVIKANQIDSEVCGVSSTTDHIVVDNLKDYKKVILKAAEGL